MVLLTLILSIILKLSSETKQKNVFSVIRQAVKRLFQQQGVSFHILLKKIRGIFRIFWKISRNLLERIGSAAHLVQGFNAGISGTPKM